VGLEIKVLMGAGMEKDKLQRVLEFARGRLPAEVYSLIASVAASLTPEKDYPPDFLGGREGLAKLVWRLLYNDI